MSMFDVHDKRRYFIEETTRDGAEKLLNGKDRGTFLIRKSQTNEGDFALSVREHERIGHYHVQKKSTRTGFEYIIGDRPFPGLPELLTFYKIHYLNDVPLRHPVYDEIPNILVTEEPEERQVLPRIARVIKARVPNSYEPNALKLERGDLIVVTEANISGRWNGKRLSGGLVQEGYFPFNFVEFVEREEEERLKADKTIADLLF